MPWQKIVLYLPNPENIGVAKEFLKIGLKIIHTKDTLINIMITLSGGKNMLFRAKY